MSYYSQRPVMIFLGGFLDEKIAKSEQNLKIIPRYGKKNLTINFVKNLIMYFKQQQQQQQQQQQKINTFSERCDDFLDAKVEKKLA